MHCNNNNNNNNNNKKKHMELKVMYCKDIKAFNFFQKLALYVVVSLMSEDPDKIKMIKQDQTQRTPADKEGGENPEWNKEETTMMQFDLEEAASLGLDHIFLKFDVRHQGAYFGDKTIAEVRVPLEDLIDETSTTTDGLLRFVSYQARGVDGGPNGLVHFSYKLLNYHGKPEPEEQHHDLPVPPVTGDQQATSVRSGGLYPVVESSIVPRSVELYVDPMGDIRPPPPPPPHCYYPAPFGMFVHHHRPPPPPPPRPPIWMQGPPHNPHSPVFHPSGAYANGGNWGQ